MDPTLEIARRLVQELARSQQRLVLAESCTGGNVAGALAAVPGVSNYFCGSLVSYRNDSKSQWLGVDRQVLDDPHVGPVSARVTALLAQAALKSTSEADLAAAVTGHVGPGSPPLLEGAVFFYLVVRSSGQVIESQMRLTGRSPQDAGDIARRAARLQEATQWVLQQILGALQRSATAS